MNLSVFSGNDPQTELALAFADQCCRWARQLGAEPAAVEAAGQAGRALSLAVAEGHVCLALDNPDLGFDPVLLAASGLAGKPGSASPLVLDGCGRLYLARYYAGEARLAHSLLARHRNLPPPPGPSALATLRALFPDQGETDWQQVAVALALGRRLTVISGGPGTGKTTTVARLLACLLADQPDLRVALAAPTGKAAARLLSSLAERAVDLPAEIRRYLPTEAGTLHRLLGLSPAGDLPRHHPGNPLAADVLVVDEASMLDLDLALQLSEALAPETRLILLGDKDQLAAVEAGAVFAVLSADPGLTSATRSLLQAWTGRALTELQWVPASPSPLADSVVWLHKSHRFAANSSLGRLAAALVQGDGNAALAALAEGGEVCLLEGEGDNLTPQEEARLLAGYAVYCQALAAYAGAPAAVFAAFDSFRILCTLRRGGRGVEAVNALLEGRLRPPGSGFWAGQPLLILSNDPATRLFNGDVGLILPTEQGLQAVFPDGAGGYRQFSPARLPAWEPAFAMTVHKSQGSEFARIALILPARDTPLLTRELIYTGITRARTGADLYATRSRLLQGLARQVRREGGLLERLGEAAALVP